MGLLFVLAAFAVGGPLAFASSQSASYLNLDLRQDRYLGGVQHSTQQSNYTQMAAELFLAPDKVKSLNYKLNARGQGAFESRDESYLGVPEAYVGTANSRVTVTAGRKIRTWSRIDEEFHLGVWQPELRWDYLKPQQQGLTGLFLEAEVSRRLRFTVFGSGVNLPDQGPQYRLDNGRFYSSNRWFQQPAGNLGLFRGTAFASDAPLYFQVDRPDDKKLFFNPSIAAAMDYQNDGFWLRTNYAYKPRNQIHLGLECTNCANLGGGTPLEITATIHPKIVMHHVATIETGFDRVDDHGWVSLTAEFPDRSQFPNEYEEAPLDDVLIAGLAYQHYLGRRIIGRPSWLQYSYLRVFEVGSKSKASLLKEEDQVQSSLDRYPLKDVAAFDWKILLSQFSSSKLNWTNRYLYSIPEQGGWLSSQLELNQGPVNWLLGADILGSSVSPASNKAGLFTRYRANDRVFGGVSYVF